MMLDETTLNTTKNPPLQNKVTAPIPLDRAAKKVEMDKRFQTMKLDGLLWRPAWMDLTKNINPLRGVYDSPPSKRPQMIDHTVILDDQATLDAVVLASGMSSGMTSQSIPWLRLTLGRPDWDEVSAIRSWLDSVQEIIYAMLDKSNIYDCLNNAYEELGIFGTACFILLEDFDDGVRGRNFTIGQYYLATDNKGRVNSFAREFWMTVGQMVKEFGYDNCSAQVRTHWDYNRRDVLIQIRHLIEPNDNRMAQMADFQNMPYRSVYWDTSDRTDVFLACRGFKRFPVIAPRWSVFTTDQVYGFGPGWYALGHIKQLQKTVLDRLLAEEKSHNPPMQADASVEGHVSSIPGGLTRTSGNAVPNAGVRPAYQIQPDIQGMLASEDMLKQKIDRHFFTNLFTMLMSIDKTNMTATEVAERQQEKIMMMGPILYKLQTELLDPLIELLYGIALDNNLLPPPPQEIAGVSIKVQYISILAQAQKSLGVQQIQRVVGFIGMCAQMNPQVTDGFDWDEALREVNGAEGAPAKLIFTQEQIDATRAQRAKLQQAQQAAAMAESASKTTKNLAGSPMGGGSALDGIMGNPPGASAGSPIPAKNS